MLRGETFFCLVLISMFLINGSVKAQVAESPAAPALSVERQQIADGVKLMREKQYDRAIEIFRQILKLNPNSANAYENVGTSFNNMGRSADALENLQAAARLEPNNWLYHLNLAVTLGNLRKGDEALAEANTAKQLNPDDDRIYTTIGNIQHNVYGRFNEALTAYYEARRLNPNAPWIYHNIGLMLIKLERFSDAIEPFQIAWKLEPNNRDAIFYLGDAYSNTGRYKEAIESYTKFLEFVPNGPEALTKRSWNYLYTGDHGREAAADARKFLDAHGWKDQTASYLVVMANFGYREAGMNDEAQAIVAAGMKKCTPDTWAYTIIRYLQGELNDEQLLKLAIDNNKKTEAHAYLGMDYLLKNKPDEARQHFNWVKEYGNKRFFEYPLAIETLERMNK